MPNCPAVPLETLARCTPFPKWIAWSCSYTATAQAGRVDSDSGQERVVFGVRSDLEPSDGVTFPESHGPITQPDAGGVEGLLLADSLELQARMRRIGPPQSIRAGSLSTHRVWESAEAFPEAGCDDRIHRGGSSGGKMSSSG